MNYSNSIKVGYDREEHGREGISGMGSRVTSGKGDCHRAASRNLNVSMDEVLTITSGNLFQYVTTRTQNACRRRRVLPRCW